MLKDLRFAAPGIVLVLLGAAGAFSLGSVVDDFIGLAFAVSLYGAHWIGAAVFGEEFAFSNGGALLSQPIGRTRLWLEKMGLILVVIVVAAILFAISSFAAQYREAVERGVIHPSLSMGGYILHQMRFFDDDLIPPLALAASAVFVAPLIALMMRGTHFAVWLALVIELVFGFLLVESVLYGFLIRGEVFNPREAGSIFLALVLIPIWLIAALSSLWLFKRLEV